MRTFGRCRQLDFCEVSQEPVSPNPQSDADQLEAAADQAIASCGGDAREAVKALLVANEFLEREIEEKVSRGYLRGVKHGRFNTYSG
jgi:Cdc6-like AAA superfamily ATPase